MAINISSNLGIESGLPLDSRYGPYSGTSQANQSIAESKRYVGLTVGIVTGTTTYNGIQLIEADGGIAEYWYYTGITDSDLVLKQEGGESATSGTSGSSGSSGSSGRDGISSGRIYYFNESETQTPSTYKNLSTTASTASEQTVTSGVTNGSFTLIVNL